RLARRLGSRFGVETGLFQRFSQNTLTSQADNVLDDFSLLVDHDNLRYCVNAICLIYFTLVIEQRRKAVAVLLQETASHLRALIVDPEHDEILVFELAMQLLDFRHLLATRPAPARPEVD